jgi:hypothetical protein
MTFGDGGGLNLADIYYVYRYVNTVRPIRTTEDVYLNNDIIIYCILYVSDKNLLPFLIDRIPIASVGVETAAVTGTMNTLSPAPFQTDIKSLIIGVSGDSITMNR